VTRGRLLFWAVVTLVLAVGLFIAQALIGLNFYDEGEHPWYLRMVQWIALLLLVVSAAFSIRALTLLRSREDS
jgi:uncharacterized membrane protein